MSIDHSPLNALAAELGEETVLQMAISYINMITERRAGIAPADWSPIISTPPRRTRLQYPLPTLVRRTMDATADNLQDLEEAIEAADDDGLSQSEEYIDAVSRLEALRAVNEMTDQ
jgi:hypothetical protein